MKNNGFGRFSLNRSTCIGRLFDVQKASNKNKKNDPKMVPEMFNMGPRWFKMDPRWALDGPSWSKMGPCWGIFGHLVAIFGHLGWYFGALASNFGPRWAKIATLELQNGGG